METGVYKVQTNTIRSGFDIALGLLTRSMVFKDKDYGATPVADHTVSFDSRLLDRLP